MNIEVVSPSAIDADLKLAPIDGTTIWGLNFYKGRRSVNTYMVRVTSEQGKELDKAMVSIDQTGKISLVSMKERIVPVADQPNDGSTTS